jgi:hypothetical protein
VLLQRACTVGRVVF